MLGFLRNLSMLVAMVWLTGILASLFGLENLALHLPRDWPYEFSRAIAVNLPMAGGVLVSSFAFCFLVQSPRPVWWVAALGLAVAALTSLSHVTLVNLQELQFGPGLLWGPLAIALACLTAMRLASAINRRRRGRQAKAA